jgi:hypothetical protein
VISDVPGGVFQVTAPKNAAGVIRQGEDFTISAKNLYSVATGEAINVTGWPVHAIARAWYHRAQLGARVWQYRMINPIMSEWSTSPTGTQGTIVTGVNTSTGETNRIEIKVTANQTNNWRSPLVLIQAWMSNPVTAEKAKIISQVYEIEFGTLPDDLKF